MILYAYIFLSSKNPNQAKGIWPLDLQVLLDSLFAYEDVIKQ